MRKDLEEMELKEMVRSFFDENAHKDFKEQELLEALEIDTEAKNEEKVLSISRHTGVLSKVIRELVEDGFIRYIQQETGVKVYRKA
jgi:hypothetical protein